MRKPLQSFHRSTWSSGVRSDNSKWTKKAKRVLERTGAQDVSSTGETSADW